MCEAGRRASCSSLVGSTGRRGKPPNQVPGWAEPGSNPCLPRQGFLSINLNSTYYELAQRHAEVPRLSAQQREALAAVGALALGDELRLDFVLQPGDLQLLSNFTQLHTRSAFLDPEARRPAPALRLPLVSVGRTVGQQKSGERSNCTAMLKAHARACSS